MGCGWWYDGEQAYKVADHTRSCPPIERVSLPLCPQERLSGLQIAHFTACLRYTLDMSSPCSMKDPKFAVYCCTASILFVSKGGPEWCCSFSDVTVYNEEPSGYRLIVARNGRQYPPFKLKLIYNFHTGGRENCFCVLYATRSVLTWSITSGV